MTQPIYFIGPPGPAREACSRVADDLRVFDEAGAFLGAADRVPGVVVMHQDDAMVMPVLLDLGVGPEWTLALADGGDPPMLRTLSQGLPAGPDALVEHAGDEEGARKALLGLREVLVQIGKTRHDVNNPLTAAVAEVQILLMDSEDDPETKEALLVVQEQLRRIRDLISATGHLRVPRE